MAIKKGGEAAAVAGATAGGAFLGAAISGPAAPIGAAVGAVVGAIIGKATSGTVSAAAQHHAACSSPIYPRHPHAQVGKVVSVPVGLLLNDVWRGLLNRKEVLELLPDVGVLRTERDFYPPAMSDLTTTNSYLYQTHPATIKGLPYEQVLAASPLSGEQHAALEAAVRALEAKKVVAITGDCGALIHSQTYVAKMTRTPVLLSALLQVPPNPSRPPPLAPRQSAPPRTPPPPSPPPPPTDPRPTCPIRP